MKQYAWYYVEGRAVYRPIPSQERKRSDLPMPLIRSDRIDPVRSMADGKVYDSLSALRATYREDGNPQRQEYVEIGDEPMKGPPPVKHATKAELSDLLDKYDAHVIRGDVPNVEAVND